MTHRLETGLHAGVTICHDADSGQDANDVVLREHSVGVRNEHVFPAIAISRRNLHDFRTRRSGCVVDPEHQIDFCSLVDVLWIPNSSGGAASLARNQLDRAGHTVTLTRRRSRSLSRLGKPRFTQVTRVRETGGFAFDYSDTCTAISPRRDLLDLAIVQSYRCVALVLCVNLCKICAGTQCSTECPFDDIAFDHDVKLTAWR